jgi:hypothetical protein
MNLARLQMNDVRFWALICAIFVYAFWGSPTPDSPDLVEGVIALLLIVAVGVAGTFGALRLSGDAPLWRAAGQWLLLYGVLVPLIIGVFSGNDTGLIIRDILPFLFMMLPVFLSDLFEDRRAYFKYFTIAVVALGIVFSVRASAEIFGDMRFFLSLAPNSDELTYLANAPTILFAALLMFGVGAQKYVSGFTVKDFARVFVLGALGILICLPMVMKLQRANIGYCALYLMALFLVGMVKYPYRTLGVFVAALVPCIYFIETLGNIAATMWQKTSLVGANMRFEDFSAVWREVISSPISLIFGEGWGATFKSPAVSGVRVNFTHSLFSSALLKSGLIGMALSATYLYGLGRLLLGLFVRYPVFVLALAGPFMIDVFLYATFKSLDFGLILLMIPVFVLSRQSVASGA